MYTPTQRLMRSRNEKVIAGVAGGIARYLTVDPVFIRLAFIALSITGLGLLLYPILCVIMPLEPEGEAAYADPAAQASPADTDRRKHLLGYALLFVGALALASGKVALGMVLAKVLFPLIVIGIGVMLLARSR
ncbi:PspC domain-containing protein [Chloroflexia bacterium SDU3-3]|nr:PspC domain-containing protein [Chloroflexia bacterium SDU3-3]